MLELFERLHKKAGTKCDQYVNRKDGPNQWKMDMSGQKYYVVQGELFDRPCTMNIYLPDGCYPSSQINCEEE